MASGDSTSIPGPCPYMTCPTLMTNGKVRDLSLTDFSGSFLLVFFFPEDFQTDSRNDLQELAEKIKQIKKAGCEFLAVSSDSVLVHSEWMSADKDEGGLGGEVNIPLMSDRSGVLAKSLGLWNDEEGMCIRGVLIVDDRGVMRHISSSSLPMEELVDGCLDIVSMLKKEKIEQVKGMNKGLLDKVWRKSIRPAEPLRKSLNRSTSTHEKDGKDKAEKKNYSDQTKSRSRSKSKTGGCVSMVSGESQEKADLFSDCVISSLRQSMKELDKTEVDLPSYSAGEMTLCDGKVFGLQKLVKGSGNPSLSSRSDVVILGLNLALQGLQSSYTVKGRRVEGSLTCNYDKIQFSVKISQKMETEVGESRPQLVLIQLQKVEGVRMDVTGFGPLNWIAGKKVSDLVQETVLQEIEDEMKYQIEKLLQNLGFYFQVIESVSPSLTPVGIMSF